MGQGHTEGEAGGEESHTLNIAELPSHSHTAQATTTTPASATQLNSLLTVTGGGRRPLTPYGDPVGLTPLHSGSMANAGGGQPHSNMQPYLVLNFCIALQGIFPTRN
jgi:microcystin-dependent protein